MYIGVHYYVNLIYICHKNNPNETVWRVVFSFFVYKDYVTVPNEAPTVARQSYTSLCIIIVREVRAAVCTYPVSVTHTLQLITANLKSKINWNFNSPGQRHEKQTLISNYHVPRLWWYWKIIDTFFLILMTLFLTQVLKKYFLEINSWPKGNNEF